MMYSATLLASLLASAHGFASTPPGNDPVCITEAPRPTTGSAAGYMDGSPPGASVAPAPPVACTTSDGRAGERFFVYSVDFSVVYEIAELHSGGKFRLPHKVTHGLVGKTWEGLQLSITQDRWIGR